MNPFLLRSCYFSWEPNLTLFLLLLVLRFVHEENLYGAISLHDLCLLIMWHLNLSVLDIQCILGAGVFFRSQIGIFKLCAIQADICVELDTDLELTSNDTVAEWILCDLDRALVTLSFSCFPLRFNLCVMSFLNKVVSDPQSNKALDSMNVCPFDSFTGINCTKVCSAPSCVFTAASTYWGDSYVWSFSRIVVCWLVW